MTSADTQDDRRQLACVRVGGRLNYVYQEESEHTRFEDSRRFTVVKWNKKKRRRRLFVATPFALSHFPTQYAAKPGGHKYRLARNMSSPAELLPYSEEHANIVEGSEISEGNTE